MKVIGFFRTYQPYGCFSNWFMSDFTIGGITFNSAEQYLMFMKAKTFNDQEIADKIMATTSQKDIKALGREVRGYDDTVWVRERYQIMVDGLYAKFSQNSDLRDKLMGTGDAILAECSPYDKIWGIGISVTNPWYTDPTLWKGQNLLGHALMQVRFLLNARKEQVKDTEEETNNTLK